ncbi:hypothetical protein J4440_06380 [Candidatus Woesearchaeota archaeon]|nr:hypothetical protein [Candidatus Woesearchaeota archaeon]
MKYKLNLGRKEIIVLALVLIIILIFLIILGAPKNCGTDESCFNTKSSQCDKVKATLNREGNQLYYNILGEKNDNCVVRVTMKKVSEAQQIELKQALEGKNMDCSIPMNLIREKNINSISNIYDYCTGSLKEAFLDITLQKLYELVIKNIGTLASGLQQVLNQSSTI